MHWLEHTPLDSMYALIALACSDLGWLSQCKYCHTCEKCKYTETCIYLLILVQHLKLGPVEMWILFFLIKRRRSSIQHGPRPRLPLQLSLTRQTIISTSSSRNWLHTYMYLHVPMQHTYAVLICLIWFEFTLCNAYTFLYTHTHSHRYMRAHAIPPHTCSDLGMSELSVTWVGCHTCKQCASTHILAHTCKHLQIHTYMCTYLHMDCPVTVLSN
jgi:hypothetical protein